MVPGLSGLMIPVKWFNETSPEYYELFRAVCSSATKRNLLFKWSCVIFRDWSKKVSVGVSLDKKHKTIRLKILTGRFLRNTSLQK